MFETMEHFINITCVVTALNILKSISQKACIGMN